jgi:hypothetical protein
MCKSDTQLFCVDLPATIHVDEAEDEVSNGPERKNSAAARRRWRRRWIRRGRRRRGRRRRRRQG